MIEKLRPCSETLCCSVATPADVRRNVARSIGRR